jgi:hypothetical protein
MRVQLLYQRSPNFYPKVFLVVSLNSPCSPNPFRNPATRAQILNLAGYSHQASTAILPVPKQTPVAMGRQSRGGASTRGRGRGRRRSASTSSRTKNSATPAAHPAGPPLKLKLNMGLGRGQQTASRLSVIDIDHLNEQQTEEEDEDELPLAEFTGGARRSGRERKPRRDAAFMYGNDIDDQIPSSALKADDEDEYTQNTSPPARKSKSVVSAFC